MAGMFSHSFIYSNSTTQVHAFSVTRWPPRLLLTAFCDFIIIRQRFRSSRGSLSQLHWLLSFVTCEQINLHTNTAGAKKKKKYTYISIIGRYSSPKDLQRPPNKYIQACYHVLEGTWPRFAEPNRTGGAKMKTKTHSAISVCFKTLSPWEIVACLSSAMPEGRLLVKRSNSWDRTTMTKNFV